MGSIHNTRILRFLIVLGTVILTIFIYASYSSNTSLTPPHIRSAGGFGGAESASLIYSAPRDHQQQLPLDVAEHSENVEKLKSSNVSSHNSLNSPNAISSQIAKSNKKLILSVASSTGVVKKPHHREPTIDADAGDGNGGGGNGGGGNGGGAGGGGGDGGVGAIGDSIDDLIVPDEAALDNINNDLLEDQYLQNIENTLGNNNNSAISGVASKVPVPPPQNSQQVLQEAPPQQERNVQLDNSLNKIPDSDVLIPTSNLQKFIENADKILKNITAAPQISPSSLIANKSIEKPDSAAKVSVINQENPQQALKVTGEIIENNNVKDYDDDVPLPPSVVMTIKRGGSESAPAAVVTANVKPASKKAAVTPSKTVPKTQNTTAAAVSVDPTQGIPTQRIYENGHKNDEIDIERLCPNKGADLKLLILITSAQSHAEARLAIRQTWGHYGTRRDVSTAFILGRTTNETINLALTQENFIYGDLIRGNFIDSYNNLTLKTISSLEWVDENCAGAKYILKTDDDMFINVPKLLAFLDSHSKEKRVIFGRLAKKWKPIRNKKSKYYVSTGQFSATVFPPFTTGPAYVMTNDIVHELYVRSLNQVYLKLEDVFTTGIVAQQLGIKRVHVNEFLNRRIAFNPCNIRKTISVHMIKSNEQFDLWKKLLDQSTKCK